MTAMPLFSAGILFQTRAVTLFNEQRHLNQEEVRLIAERDARGRTIEGMLPEGYSLLPYGENDHGKPTFALRDEHGAGIAFPLLREEAFDRAWQYCGKPAPSIEGDAQIQVIDAQLAANASAKARLAKKFDDCRAKAERDFTKSSRRGRKARA